MESFEASETYTHFAEKIKELIMIENESQSLIDELDNCLENFKKTIKYYENSKSSQKEKCNFSISNKQNYDDQNENLALSTITKSEVLIERLKKKGDMFEKLKQLIEIAENVENSL
uniref:Uncharacterized protein n=1 Tax=Strongyloides stercoralis TaxID=6248 RepID=A0A0K0EM56_STRER